MLGHFYMLGASNVEVPLSYQNPTLPLSKGGTLGTSTKIHLQSHHILCCCSRSHHVLLVLQLPSLLS
jgi:hypothetical protein